MSKTNNGVMRIGIILLAILSVVLLIVFIIGKTDAQPEEQSLPDNSALGELAGYGQEMTSDSRLTYTDDGIVEMDQIDGQTPSSSDVTDPTDPQ